MPKFQKNKRGKVERARGRAQNTEPRKFGSTTMLSPAPRKAGQQTFSSVRLGKSLAQCGIDNPIEAPQLCSRIAKFSISFTLAAMAHPANQVRVVWY